MANQSAASKPHRLPACSVKNLFNFWQTYKISRQHSVSSLFSISFKYLPTTEHLQAGAVGSMFIGQCENELSCSVRRGSGHQWTRSVACHRWLDRRRSSFKSVTSWSLCGAIVNDGDRHYTNNHTGDNWNGQTTIWDASCPYTTYVGSSPIRSWHYSLVQHQT